MGWSEALAPAMLRRQRVGFAPERLMVMRVQQRLNSVLRATLVASGLAVLLAASGCGASAGEPCKEADDCQSGLVCCKPGSGGPSARGTCEMSCSGDEPTPDAAAADDAAVADAAADDAAVDDAAADDAAADDASA